MGFCKALQMWLQCQVGNVGTGNLDARCQDIPQLNVCNVGVKPWPGKTSSQQCFLLIPAPIVVNPLSWKWLLPICCMKEAPDHTIFFLLRLFELFVLNEGWIEGSSEMFCVACRNWVQLWLLVLFKSRIIDQLLLANFWREVLILC